MIFQGSQCVNSCSKFPFSLAFSLPFDFSRPNRPLLLCPIGHAPNPAKTDRRRRDNPRRNPKIIDFPASRASLFFSIFPFLLLLLSVTPDRTDISYSNRAWHLETVRLLDRFRSLDHKTQCLVSIEGSADARKSLLVNYWLREERCYLDIGLQCVSSGCVFSQAIIAVNCGCVWRGLTEGIWQGVITGIALTASVRENVSKLGNLTIRESMAKKMKITEISMLRDFSSWFDSVKSTYWMIERWPSKSTMGLKSTQDFPPLFTPLSVSVKYRY